MDVMSQVRDGMRVLESDGTEVGTVEAFKAGDPQAVTSEGQLAGRDDGFVQDMLRGAFGSGEDVPPQFAERLLRTGFVRIDGKGLFGKDRFVGADQLDRVADDALWLKPGYRSVEP